MTREAKIGMLTGLGVIVMIGVLLSNYLGDPKASGAASPGGAYASTGRMADLGVGEAYRQQVMQPVGVPALASPGARTMEYAGGSEIATPINVADRSAPPAAFAVEAQQMHATPVVPVPAGPATDAMASRMDGPPLISIADQATTPVKVNNAAAPALTSVTYTVVAGDSLGKIAKKFYNSSKNSDIQHIVAANPGVLKDTSTPIVAGKKLVIPNVAAASPVKKTEPVTIYPPGDLAKSSPTIDPARKVQPPAAAPGKTTVYVVQSGDTLEKISRRLAPAKVNDMVQKLIALNGIKDPTNLQVGAKLKVPA